MTHPERTPITSTESLRTHWHRLLTGVTHHGRSAWIMAHESDGTPLEQIVIVDDLPLRPEREDVTGFGRLVHEFVARTPTAAGVIVLFSRPGTDRLAAFEEDWERAVVQAAGDAMQWPVCCASPHGVTVLGRA